MGVKSRRKRERRAASEHSAVADIFVPQPFANLVSEADWIALREFVPAASAPLRLHPDLIERFGERPVTVATVLPMAWPAWCRPDGHILIGLQRHIHSGDPSRDLACALLCVLEPEPGAAVRVPPLPGAGPRLQDVLDDAELDVTLHDSFAFWLADGELADSGVEVQASLERANASLYPSARLAAARGAYWCRLGQRAHVRWVLADEEDAALAALARLGAAGELTLGKGTRFAGMFRAYGRLVPVWDLPAEEEADRWEAPLAEFAARYAAAVREDAPLTAEQRRAKQGLLGRQQMLR